MPTQPPKSAQLLQDYAPPCLSLYQATHRHHPANDQDPIRYRNLVKQLETSLAQEYSAAESERLLEPFHALSNDRDFWNHTLDGLAVLGAKDTFHVFRVQSRVPELAIVANTMHTKPLLRILQSADRYQVLCLNQKEISLHEGNRDGLDELTPLLGVPRTLTEALGSELTEPHLTVASYGGVGGQQPAMHHGQGGKSPETDIDAERFFRAVDRGILDHYSRPSGLPLILVTLPEHRHLFHQVSENPYLMTEGIAASPNSLTPDELRQRAWQIIEPSYQKQLAALVEEFGQAKAKSRGDDDLSAVGRAIAEGRVGTLMVEGDRQIPGSVADVTGKIELADLEHPDIDDVLDDLCSLALKSGARVVVAAAEQMPTETGVAAIYRY